MLFRSGILINRGNSYPNAFIGWKEQSQKFILGSTTNNSSTTGSININTGSLLANIEGNIQAYNLNVSNNKYPKEEALIIPSRINFVGASSNLYQYDWKSQKCYLYKEPLLGTNGINGNVITYTATKIANNSKRPIVIIPFGVGGTSVLQWAYGDLSQHHQIVMKRVKESGLPPRIFLWHQGESDPNLPEAVY